MKKLMFVVLVLLICTTLVFAEEPIYDHFVYLPLAAGGVEFVPTPTKPPPPTNTPYPTATPTFTPSPTCDCSDDLYNFEEEFAWWEAYPELWRK